MAIDMTINKFNNVPNVALFNYFESKCKFVWYSKTDTWEYSVVDESDAEWSPGGNLSICLSPNDTSRHISYYDDSDLKYAKQNPETGLFESTTIDKDVDVCWWTNTSIAVDSKNKVYISYIDQNFNLMIADNTAGFWKKEKVASFGYFNVLKMDKKDYWHLVYDDMYVTQKIKPELTDYDNDGVPDNIEQGPDHIDTEYDGNGDSKPDWKQGNVAYFYIIIDYYITLACPEVQGIVDVQSIENPSVPDAPFNVDFPFEFLDFKVTGMGAGEKTTVTIYLPEDKSLTSYWKYGPTHENTSPHWYEFTGDEIYNTGYEIFEDKIALYLKDGQNGDYDLTANDTIQEPGAPGKVLLPNIAISQEEIKFDTIVPGGYQKKYLYILNNGAGKLIIDSVVISGTDSPDFTMESELPDTIYPEVEKKYNLLFNPSLKGDKSCNLTIFSSGSDSEEILLSGTCMVPSVGIINHPTDYTFKIMPNPATDHIQVIAEESSLIRIYNSMGILIYETLTADSAVQIETNDLPAGIYIVEISNKNAIIRSKVIIQ